MLIIINYKYGIFKIQIENLDKYDDMELLKATKAKLHGDNYFVEE
jgi:hypothetical protein